MEKLSFSLDIAFEKRFVENTSSCTVEELFEKGQKLCFDKNRCPRNLLKETFLSEIQLTKKPKNFSRIVEFVKSDELVDSIGQ